MRLTRPCFFPMRRAAIAAVLFLWSLWWGVNPGPGHAEPPSTVLDTGYLDFSYATAAGDPVKAPTGEKAESKLWWHDGFWWALLYNRTTDAYHIYRLNWGTQTWEDTHVQVDDRRQTKADALWDAAGGKLYIASHMKKDNASRVNRPINWARLYRFSYDAEIQTFVPDTGFPVLINEDKTETLVLNKSTTGRLWVAYVSRVPAVDPTDYQVYVNYSTDNDATWATPFSLATLFPEAHVSADDIAALVAFRDNQGDHIGVMWSNQRTGDFYFAIHPDSTPNPRSGWRLETISLPAPANDHISLRAYRSAGQVFAAIKTSATQPTDPQIGLIARDEAGHYSFHPYSLKSSKDTRPLLVIDEADNQVYLFVTDKTGGRSICYQATSITTPLADMRFVPADCYIPFIADEALDGINDATSTKQNLDQTTGLVVLASDEQNGQFYVHNVLGNPPPVVTERRPAPHAIAVPVEPDIRITFSKPMQATSFTPANIALQGPASSVSNAITYDSPARTVSLVPNSPLHAYSTYTLTLHPGLRDETGQQLYGAPRSWSFETGQPHVRFDNNTLSVNESAGMASIRVVLNTPSTRPATVAYTTLEGTATGNSDFAPVSGVLSFEPGVTEQTLTLPILNDEVVEGNEILVIDLSDPTQSILAAPSRLTVTIVDDDQASTIQFNPSTVSVREAQATAEVQVGLNQPAPITVTVAYATHAGTASAGEDYVHTSGTLIFPPGTTDRVISIPILEDVLDEPDENLTIVLSQPENATLGTPDHIATLTILDNDPPPRIQFQTQEFRVFESQNQATIVAILDTPSSQTVTVEYASTDGTATAAADYQAVIGTLTFAPGETSQSFTVSTIDDPLDETDETVHLTLAHPTNATLGLRQITQLRILDNDPPPSVQFGTMDCQAAESAGLTTMTITLNTPSGQSVSVDFDTLDGTAQAGTDYTAVAGSLTFAPGQTSRSIQIPIHNDRALEMDETFSLELSNPDDAVLGIPFRLTCIILDNDNRTYLPFLAVQHP